MLQVLFYQAGFSRAHHRRNVLLGEAFREPDIQ
jgi:hypothetical protein